MRRLPQLGLGPQPAAVAVAAVYLGAMGYAMSHTGYRVWGAFIVGPALIAISVPMVRAAGRRETDAGMRRIIYWAFALKMLSAVPRYMVAFVLYDGGTDAVNYHDVGSTYAPMLRTLVLPDYDGNLVGTTFMELLTGGLYAVTGPTFIGGYLVFTWIAFWGTYLCYRAFRRAVPDGQHRNYALLIFLWPSLLYWPTGIGKEAVMMLCIGVAVYGAARVYTRTRFGFLFLGAGLASSALVRPHITLILFAATSVGYLLRSSGPRATALSPVAKMSGIVVLAGASVLVMQQAATFLEVDGFDGSGVDKVIADAVERTDEGGSTFEAQPVTSPADVPLATATVLIRPFPWEAHNPQALVTAAEGMLLLYLCWRHRSRLRRLPLLLRQSYPAFCVAYGAMFVYAFSTFGNFAILARERVMVLPFVLALLCLPRRGLTSRGHLPNSRKHLVHS
jgi:hypothetical protein